jgi:hypothetical protein
VRWEADFCRPVFEGREEAEGLVARRIADEGKTRQRNSFRSEGKGRAGGYDLGHRGPSFQRKPRAFGVVYFFLTLARWSSYTLHKRIFYRKIETIRRLETMKPGAASFARESGE